MEAVACTAVEAPRTAPSRVARLEGLLAPWVDHEWPLFLAAMLIPAMACVVAGYDDRIAFFTRLALLLGGLKWLGWAAVTRSSLSPRRFLLFPAELLIGLTIVALYFYVRSLASAVLPGSFSLAELAFIPWLVIALHAFGMIRTQSAAGASPSSHEPLMPTGALQRAAVYGAFAATVALTLWGVANTIYAPSQDGWFHTFIARVYRNDGLFFKHFNGGDTIFYVSGFGAINAAVSAMSGLSALQTHNLQHILWAVVGMYFVTTAAALLADRRLALLYVVPPVFLSIYPVHNLPPDIYWTHTPQQLAPPLLVAIPLLGLLLPVVSRPAIIASIASQAGLSLLIVVLNPVCGAFAPIFWALALVITCVRVHRAGTDNVRRTVVLQLLISAGLAVLLMGSDRFYSAMVLQRGEASYMDGSHYGVAERTTAKRPFTLSLDSGRAAAANENPMVLSADWPGDLPVEATWRRVLPWAAVLLTALACVLWVGRARGPSTPAARLAAVAIASVLVWIVVKYAVVFAYGAITNPTADARLFRGYLGYFPPRLEIWLLYVATVAAAASIHVRQWTVFHRAAAGIALAACVITAAAWHEPEVRTRLDLRNSLLVARNQGAAGRVSTDDIELASWIEKHITPEMGLVGLSSMAFRIRDTKLLFPSGSSQTLPMYGNGYNFCFQVFDPGRHYSYDDYVEHVATYFDANWLLRNGIRYFHLPYGDLWPSHGLIRAREAGLLKPIRAVTTSALYAVEPLPWTPQTIRIPATPAGTYQVEWNPDGSGKATGNDARLVFALERPTFVHAIRFRYELSNGTEGALTPQIFWTSGARPFNEQQTARLRLERTTREETLTVLVHDTIDRFRFDPDVKPCTFRIRDIELLVKPDGTD